MKELGRKLESEKEDDFTGGDVEAEVHREALNKSGDLQVSAVLAVATRTAPSSSTQRKVQTVRMTLNGVSLILFSNPFLAQTLALDGWSVSFCGDH